MPPSETLSSSEPKKPAVSQSALERLVAQVGGAREVADIYPLSPLQQGLLFHSLLDPSSSVYLTSLNWRLHGPLDVAA